MLRANITQIFIVDYNYKVSIDYFKSFNHSLVFLTDQELVFEKNGAIIKFELDFYEEDTFKKTLLSQLEDGTPFRIIKPIGVSKEINLLESNSLDCFSVGSVNPDGYSVAFILTSKNDIRNIDIVMKGIDDQLQNLATGAMMALQQNLNYNFYNISRRLIAAINTNNKNIHQLEYGSQIAEILRANYQRYDEIEQRIINKL